MERKVMAIHLENLDRSSLIILLNSYRYALENNFSDVVLFGDGVFRSLCEKEDGCSYSRALDTFARTIPCSNSSIQTSPVKTHIFLGDASNKLSAMDFSDIYDERDDLDLITTSNGLRIPFGTACLAFYSGDDYFDDNYDTSINIFDDSERNGRYDNFYVSSRKGQKGKKIPGVMCFELKKSNSNVNLKSYELETENGVTLKKNEYNEQISRKKNLYLSKTHYTHKRG